MTDETLSIPIAPASDCCSNTPTSPTDLPIVNAANGEGCCESTSISQTSADASKPHGESCSHHAAAAVTAIAAPATPDAEPKPAAEVDVPAPDDAALIDALREVVDPELMINIVDLGLVYSINQTDRKVIVEMTLTSPACPAGPQIVSQAKMSIEKLPGVGTAEIKLTMSPPWTPDRMTDDARDQLGIF